MKKAPPKAILAGFGWFLFGCSLALLFIKIPRPIMLIPAIAVLCWVLFTVWALVLYCHSDK